MFAAIIRLIFFNYKIEVMTKFKYEIGTDCWLVEPGYGHQLFRCHVLARIQEETSEGISVLYRVKLEGRSTETPVPEAHLFDVATRCHDALCFFYSILKNDRPPQFL